MYVLAGGRKGPFSGLGARPQLRVNTTHYGFNVAIVPKVQHDRANLAEAIFKVAGTMMIPAGGIVLILPKVVEGSAQLLAQAALLLAFVATGIALHRWADKGFRPRIEVDSTRNEVRVGTVNSEGDFHISDSYPTSAIESFYIVRAVSQDAPSKLNMRLKTGTKTITVIEGPERLMVPILERITATLRPPQMKGRRVRTMTTGRFIRATFG